MGYVRIKRQVTTGTVIPDNALLYFNSTTNEYYVITDSLGNILTWSSA